MKVPFLLLIVVLSASCTTTLREEDAVLSASFSEAPNQDVRVLLAQDHWGDRDYALYAAAVWCSRNGYRSFRASGGDAENDELGAVHTYLCGVTTAMFVISKVDKGIIIRPYRGSSAPYNVAEIIGRYRRVRPTLGVVLNKPQHGTPANAPSAATEPESRRSSDLNVSQR